ncbi:MAG: DUF2892 domain-containing protein [Cytophagaceae bacterium]
MTANVCGREKTTRWILGIVLFVLGLIITGVAGWILGILGIISILTALFSYCPVNYLAGRNTCSIAGHDEGSYTNRDL